MARFKNRYRIESARKRGWDYTIGWYFVTICTYRRQPCLGAVVDEVVHLSAIGDLVATEWQRTPVIRPYVCLDAWVIMPDHIHAIIGINTRPLTDTVPPAAPHHPDGVTLNDDAVETARRAVSTAPPGGPPPPPPGGPPPPPPGGPPPPPGASPVTGNTVSPSLGTIIGQFKSVVTKRVRAAGYHDFAWQERFYDVIIHDARALEIIRRYIATNPQRWTD